MDSAVFLTEPFTTILNLDYIRRILTISVPFNLYFQINLIKYSPDPPLIVSGNGYRMGLSLVLDAQLNEYSVTNGKFDGFKVSSNNWIIR